MAGVDPWFQAVLLVAGNKAGDRTRWDKAATPVAEAAYASWLAAERKRKGCDRVLRLDDIRAELRDDDGEARAEERASRRWCSASTSSARSTSSPTLAGSGPASAGRTRTRNAGPDDGCAPPTTAGKDPALARRLRPEPRPAPRPRQTGQGPDHIPSVLPLRARPSPTGNVHLDLLRQLRKQARNVPSHSILPKPAGPAPSRSRAPVGHSSAVRRPRRSGSDAVPRPHRSRPPRIGYQDGGQIAVEHHPDQQRQRVRGPQTIGSEASDPLGVRVSSSSASWIWLRRSPVVTVADHVTATSMPPFRSKQSPWAMSRAPSAPARRPLRRGGAPESDQREHGHRNDGAGDRRDLADQSSLVWSGRAEHRRRMSHREDAPKTLTLR